MKAVPTDPELLRLRTFGAFCEDLFDMAAGKARSCQRTDAILEVVKQRKEPRT